MQLDIFKHEFKKINGCFLDAEYVLFRHPLHLYNLKTGETVKFKNLDDALDYKINGKTIECLVASWKAIVFPSDKGGRGSDSGSAFSGKWPSAMGGNADDNSTSDFPARMNVKTGVHNSYEGALQAFINTHAAAGKEHGIVVDEMGYVHTYRHGNASSISGLTGTATQIAIHNHPKDGWPTFSKEDIVNTALGSRKGIVAVSSTTGRDSTTAKYAGTYSFVKAKNFNSSRLVKALNNATISGKDYNDAVDKWLKANQKNTAILTPIKSKGDMCLKSYKGGIV